MSPYRLVALLVALLAPDCDEPICGNGIVETGELCDDGNKVDSDECANDCTRCGNGVVDEGEECDDGNHVGHDDCSPQCKVTPYHGSAAPPPSPPPPHSKSRP